MPCMYASNNILRPAHWMVRVTQKRDAPAAVQKVIELANSVPPDLDLPPFTRDNGSEILRLVKTQAFSRFRLLIGGTKPDRFFPELFSKLNIAVVHARTSAGKRHPLKEGARNVTRPRPPKTYNRVIGEYVRLRAAREFLRWISTIPPLPLRWSMPPLTLQSAQINERGELHFVFLFEEFEGVEADRIRTCPPCGRIYWARRKDQPGCSQRCVWRIRQQRWRERYLKRYKVQRIRAQQQEDNIGAGLLSPRR
jgi:hypothetical protein